jgi:mannose-6-phosphate isomerase-like protein (cupin superfamily)
MSSDWVDVDLRRIRRVVTGFDADGVSRVIFDGVADHYSENPKFEGVSTNLFWRAAPGLHREDVADGTLAYERLPIGGTQFYITRIGPGVVVPRHVTETTEYHCVVSGAIVCVLDDGEVTVGVGEVLIQRGTPHAWENRGAVPFVSVAMMISARTDQA